MQTKRAKTSRNRGSNSHGWGHKKKHRGAGHRGGVGLSGTGARGDAQKSGLLAGAKKFLKKVAARKGVKLSTIVSGKAYFGKHGFKSVHKTKIKSLSISYVESNYDMLVKDGIIVKDTIDTVSLGYDKVLGRSKFTKKIKFIVKDVSATAKSKIEEAGGSVELLHPKKEK